MITNWILRDGIYKSAEAFSPFVAVEHGGVGRRKQTINEGKLRKKGCRINGWDAAPYRFARGKSVLPRRVGLTPISRWRG